MVIKTLNLFKFGRTCRLGISRMATSNLDASPTNGSNISLSSHTHKCIFCNIVADNNPEKIIYQDDEIVAFADIKPASKHHYLIVPKKHLTDAKRLNSTEKSLVENMINVGKQVLERMNADSNDVRTGFHWPPFHTVSHLHLHVISPASEMNFLSRMIFKANSLWFVSPEFVMSRL